MLPREEDRQDPSEEPEPVSFRCQDVVGFITYAGSILSRRELKEEDLVYISGPEWTPVVKGILNSIGSPARIIFATTDTYTLSIFYEGKERNEMFVQVDEMGRIE